MGSADAASGCQVGVARRTDGLTDAERHRATTAMRRRECLSGTAGRGVDGELPKSPAASGGKKTQRWAGLG